MMSTEETDNNTLPENDIERESFLIAEYLTGMPRVSIGALVMPPIWGPAQGIWATILWYPLWVFADNCLFAWWSTGSTLATVTGVLSLVILIGITVAFAVLSTPYSALRAIQKGKTKEEYQRSERIWAIVSILLGIAFIAFATFYNLTIRPPLVA